jgi:type II secretory pathway pseudopilin PulG
MHKPRGFTLIELMLYISVSAMVLLSLSVFFFTVLNARVKNESMLEVDMQGDAAMRMMLQTIRNAQSITLPVAGDSSGSLTLVVEDAGASPTVFSASETAILITEGVDDPIALTNSHVVVTGFSVQNLSRTGTPGNVRVTFTLSRASDSARNEYDYSRSFTGSASLRQP